MAPTVMSISLFLLILTMMMQMTLLLLQTLLLLHNLLLNQILLLRHHRLVTDVRNLLLRLKTLLLFDVPIVRTRVFLLLGTLRITHTVMSLPLK